MVAPKKVAKKKALPAKRAAAPKLAPGSKAAFEQMRSARDAFRGPSATRIEQSLDKGKSISLDQFRSIIKWS